MAILSSHVLANSTKKKDPYLEHILNAQAFETISLKLVAISKSNGDCDLLKDAIKYSEKGIMEAKKVGNFQAEAKKIKNNIVDIKKKYNFCTKK